MKRETSLRPLALALTALLLVAASCPRGSGSQEPAVAGCYYFIDRDAAGDLRLPWGVRLQETPLEGWPIARAREGVRLAATLTPAGDADHPFGYWAPLPGDSIEVGYPAGGGSVLRLAVAPDTLSGTSTPVGDAVPLEGATRPVRPVRLMRALCPEESE